MPYEVKALFDRFLVDGYQHIQIEKKQIVVDQLDHSFVRIPELKKLPFLESYLTANQFDKILVFAQTKRSVNELQNIMNVEGYEIFGLHGDVDQYERINAMKAVKAANKVILVATDVASRGLNLNDIDLVVNFDMPQDPEDYVHRV
jgi:superfamily II DNA/RNA helicase